MWTSINSWLNNGGYRTIAIVGGGIVIGGIVGYYCAPLIGSAIAQFAGK